MNVHWTQSITERKPEQKSDVAVGTIFGIGQCFKRSKQKPGRQAKKLKTICTSTQSIDLIVLAF
jgi:hypothetical protein